MKKSGPKETTGQHNPLRSSSRLSQKEPAPHSVSPCGRDHSLGVAGWHSTTIGQVGREVKIISSMKKVRIAPRDGSGRDRGVVGKKAGDTAAPSPVPEAKHIDEGGGETESKDKKEKTKTKVKKMKPIKQQKAPKGLYHRAPKPDDIWDRLAKRSIVSTTAEATTSQALQERAVKAMAKEHEELERKLKNVTAVNESLRKSEAVLVMENEVMKTEQNLQELEVEKTVQFWTIAKMNLWEEQQRGFELERRLQRMRSAHVAQVCLLHKKITMVGV